jgi:hypothetical protein
VTTKVSQLARKFGPGLQPSPQMRIVIDIQPNGTSTMRAEGGVNQILIALTLSSQLNALLPNMFKAVFQSASGVIGPDGTPVLGKVVPDTMDTQVIDEGPYPEEVQK